MTLHDSTICAISTPAGTGGIAVVRISGSRAIEIADTIWRGKSLAKAKSHTAHLGPIVDPDNNYELDTAVATIFRAPNSFTGEDTVEFSVHGSPFIQSELLQLLTRQGCEIAQPGEFTRRAFANGRLDLTQAEAVADLIAASSRAAHRIATQQMHGSFSQRLSQLRQQLIDLSALLELELDFSDQEVEFAPRDQLIALAKEIHAEVSRLAQSFAIGQAIANGIPVAIIGNTNAGKSTLLNTLLQRDRAIVSPIKGTTRDTIEETTTINGTLYRLIDTAGLRPTDDPIENLGIERTLQTIAKANIILWLIDPADIDSLSQTAKSIAQHKQPDATLITLLNKSDLNNGDDLGSGNITDLGDFLNLGGDSSDLTETLHSPILRISAKNGTGIDQLTAAIHAAAHIDELTDDVTVTNARHHHALTLAKESTQRVIDGLNAQIPADLNAQIPADLNAQIPAGLNAQIPAGLNAQIPADLIAQDLRQTLHHLSTITGQITAPDILTTIFSRFCIGK